MFDKVVFAGGGQRCWWQAGFWEVLRDEIELRPRVIGAVSMGAFMACLVHANDARRALAWFERELAGVSSNVTVTNLFRKDAPLFRQGGIYRRAMRALLGGEHFRQLMWQAPEIRVSCALAPAALTERQLNRLGWREYRHDARLQPASLHEPPGHGEAFTPFVKRLQDCRTERDMSDLLQACSAWPPVVAPVSFDGDRACTGELIDPVPVNLVSDVPGQTLVLTTRTYNRKTPVFAMKGCIYVQPSAPVPVSSWDFTSAHRAQQTYEQGRQDGEAFLKLFGLGAFGTGKRFDGALLAGGGWGDEAREETVIADEAVQAGEAARAARAGDAGADAGSVPGAPSPRPADADGAGGTKRSSGAAKGARKEESSTGTSDETDTSGASGAAGSAESDGLTGAAGSAGSAGSARGQASSGAAGASGQAGRSGTSSGRAGNRAGKPGAGAGAAGVRGVAGDEVAREGMRASKAKGRVRTSEEGTEHAGKHVANAGDVEAGTGAGVRKRSGASSAMKTAGAADRPARRRVDGEGSASEDSGTGASGGSQAPAHAGGAHGVADAVEEDPLTLTDGHTLGEPSDKLFERAGRLRRNTAATAAAGDASKEKPAAGREPKD